MTREIEVERTYVPDDDTEDRVRRVISILLDDEPRERPGEAA